MLPVLFLCILTVTAASFQSSDKEESTLLFDASSKLSYDKIMPREDLIKMLAVELNKEGTSLETQLEIKVAADELIAGPWDAKKARWIWLHDLNVSKYFSENEGLLWHAIDKGDLTLLKDLIDYGQSDHVLGTVTRYIHRYGYKHFQFLHSKLLNLLKAIKGPFAYLPYFLAPFLSDYYFDHPLLQKLDFTFFHDSDLLNALLHLHLAHYPEGKQLNSFKGLRMDEFKDVLLLVDFCQEHRIDMGTWVEDQNRSVKNLVNWLRSAVTSADDIFDQVMYMFSVVADLNTQDFFLEEAYSFLKFLLNRHRSWIIANKHRVTPCLWIKFFARHPQLADPVFLPDVMPRIQQLVLSNPAQTVSIVPIFKILLRKYGRDALFAGMRAANYPEEVFTYFILVDHSSLGNALFLMDAQLPEQLSEGDKAAWLAYYLFNGDEVHESMIEHISS